MRPEPSESNGYAGARFLRDTPYKSVTEWSRAIIDAIPEDERCPVCEGKGVEVIYAQNGGLSELAPCWACYDHPRRKRRYTDV
jgi:hypothetical protein